MIYLQRAKLLVVAVLVLGLLVVVGGCSRGEDKTESKLTGEIKIDGSSTVFPISEQ